MFAIAGIIFGLLAVSRKQAKPRSEWPMKSTAQVSSKALTVGSTRFSVRLVEGGAPQGDSKPKLVNKTAVALSLPPPTQDTTLKAVD